MKIRPMGAEFFLADRLTDMTKLIVAFRSLAIAPNKRAVNAERVDYYNGSRTQQHVGLVIKICMIVIQHKTLYWGIAFCAVIDVCVCIYVCALCSVCDPWPSIVLFRYLAFNGKEHAVCTEFDECFKLFCLQSINASCWFSDGQLGKRAGRTNGIRGALSFAHCIE
jgi:hypothetical protein